MSKQLPISVIQDEVKTYNEYIEIPLTLDSEEFTVKLYPLFKPEKIRDMIQAMSDFYQSAAKEKVKITPEEESDLMAYFLLRTFTDIRFGKYKKAKKMYEEYKMVVNSKTMKEISSFFPEESIEEVNKYIFEMLENSAKLERKVKAMQKQIKNLPLENRNEVLGALGLRDEIDGVSGEVNG